MSYERNPPALADGSLEITSVLGGSDDFRDTRNASKIQDNSVSIRKEKAAQIREHINELASFAERYAEQAQGFAWMADDAGLSYCVEALALHSKALIEAIFDLEAVKAGGVQ
jgi:hypothetical protein